MNFPIYPDKYELKEMYGAKEIVAYRRQVGRMPSLSSPQGILFCLERGLPWRMRWKIPVKRAGGMNGDLYALKKPRDKIGIMTGFGGGSPMTVELAEEFAAMGVRCMILMTWGGLLQPDLKPGDLIVVDRAIRDEGTSYHYLLLPGILMPMRNWQINLLMQFTRQEEHVHAAPPGPRMLHSVKPLKKSGNFKRKA